MKGYFNNPELKKSTICLLIIMLIFMMGSYIIIKYNNEKMKSDYLSLLGGITAKMLEIDPQLDLQIVPMMTRELTEEEELKGKDILRQYGLSEKLELSHFPYIKHSFRNNIISILFLGFALTVILFVFNFKQYKYLYDSMKHFTSAAKGIVDGDYHLKLSEIKEGELSKLAQSFNSMGAVIRGNIFALKKEKEFLVDLLSDISHQLKTPLSTMILYNDIMLAKELTKEQRDVFLKNNQNQLNRMSWLIHNLLKLAKIDANAIELQKEKQSLNETLEEVIEILESKASEARVNLCLIQSNNIIFNHDRLWLQEALINAIKNAIEHSNEGSCVEVQVEDNPAYTRIAIKNTGGVIPEEDLANLFKRFYKGKKTKKRDSIGIGLSLTKSIIEKHGGYIEAKSNIQEGTSLIMTFIKY